MVFLMYGKCIERKKREIWYPKSQGIKNVYNISLNHV